jgi:hypothetical protein
MKDISISLPEKALKQVNQWADTSGSPRDEFYREALILGARVMAISAPPDFLADLSTEEMEHISESANRSVTPRNVLQIITGAKSRTLLGGSEGPITELVVNLPDDLFEQFSEQANRISMQHEKFFSLAFAMGARTISINNQLNW